MPADGTAVSQPYDRTYFAQGCGRPYQRDEYWLTWFGRIADRIVNEIGPRTVLDAGCAMGFLVEALRDRGVEAYGLDVSDYALDQVRADIKPYCTRGSITAPLPRRYDLIVCVEVLEHLSPDEAATAAANLCGHTDDLLFSSTSSDYTEATHVNVRPPEYWAELFARQDFYRDVDYDASFVAGWAVRLRRARDPLARQIGNYERLIVRLRDESASLRELAGDHRDQIAKLQTEVERLHREQAAYGIVGDSMSFRLASRLAMTTRQAFPPASRRGSLLRWVASKMAPARAPSGGASAAGPRAGAE